MSNDYQNLIYENKIQILNDRLQCYSQQIQNLKKTNDILLTRIKTIQNIDEQLEKQKLKNTQLRQLLQSYKNKYQELFQKHQQQIYQLKKQIDSKQQFIQMIKQQNQKIITKKQQQINFYRQNLKQKAQKIKQYQKKMHSIQIQKLNTSDSDNFISYESKISYKNGKQNMNTLNDSKKSMNQQDKTKLFYKKDKQELKIMLNSLTNAKKCLQYGGQQMKILDSVQTDRSMLSLSTMHRKSVQKNHNVNINKTYFK